MAAVMGVELVGMGAAVLTTVAFVPQVIRTWRSKSAKDISLGWLITFISGVSLWLVYGLLLMAWPIIIANVVTFSLVAMLFWMRLNNGG